MGTSSAGQMTLSGPRAARQRVPRAEGSCGHRRRGPAVGLPSGRQNPLYQTMPCYRAANVRRSPVNMRLRDSLMYGIGDAGGGLALDLARWRSR